MDKAPIPMCRICGTQFNLMHVLQGGQELQEKLLLCANIQVDIEGDLPKHICLKCVEGVNFSYRLRKQGEAMELRLRQQQQDNSNEINLVDEVDDVEDALQEFRVANAKKSKNIDNQVQIINVIENVQAKQSTNATNTIQTVNINLKQVEATKVNVNHMENVNNLVSNVISINEISNVTDIVHLDDDDDDEVCEEFISLEDDYHKTAQVNLDFMQEKTLSLDEQSSNTIEIVENIAVLNEINIGSIEQLNSVQNTNDLTQNIEYIEDDDDVQIVADYPPLNSLTSFVNIENLNLNKTPNYNLQQHIVEYLERSRPVKVTIVKRNETLPQVQKVPQSDETSFAPQYTGCSITALAPQYTACSLNKQTTIQEDSINDIIDIDADNEDDIIEECDYNEQFVEYESIENPEDSYQFETLQKYSIDIENMVNADVDTSKQESASNSVGQNITLPQNRRSDLDMRIVTFKCDTCSQEFRSQSEYRSHIKLHGSERYNCIQCNKWFPTRYRLQQHERIHNSVEMYECELCANTYRHRQNLKRHLISAHGDQKTFNCNQCEEVFARADILKNHMSIHTNERNFICELCSKSFKSNFYLMSHKRSHQLKANASLGRSSHSTATNTGTCTSTSDESSNPSQMVNDKRTFYCVHCGKISKHHFSHKNHLRTHTLEMPYECEYCLKKFRTMAARITHERIHTDERPYQCQRCHLTFRQSSHLKEHILIHDGTMGHVCNICNMAFTKKCNMKVHMRIHTGERPYKCAQLDCGQQFAKLAQLKRHAAQTHARNVEVLANEDDDELSSGNETEQGEINNHFDSEELLDVGIGAEETAIELVNDSHYNSLYVFDEIVNV